MSSELEPIQIQNKILIIRNQQVMIDCDLAEMYGVETKVLNQAVKRNIQRFPERFHFQLTENEFEILRSQFVTSKTETRGGRQYLPYAFTEQGCAMLSACRCQYLLLFCQRRDDIPSLRGPESSACRRPVYP